MIKVIIFFYQMKGHTPPPTSPQFNNLQKLWYIMNILIVRENNTNKRIKAFEW